MTRATINALLDAIAAALFLAMLATGFVLQFVLPPGTGKAWMLWALERHDWARLHAVISALLLIVLVAHVALHWKWVVEVVGRRLGGRRISGQRAAIAVIGALLLLAAGFAVATLSTREPRSDLASCEVPGCAVTSSPQDPSPSPPSYIPDIAPILAARCVNCHRADRLRGGVRLDGYTHVIGYLEKGAPARSRLLNALDPPIDAAHTVDAATLRQLERWIATGAGE